MPKLQPNKPLLFLLYGFPGSGKTHFARQLVDHVNCAHVQADRLRSELFESPTYSQDENTVVTHMMNYMTEEFLNAGVSVIYDDNADRIGKRQALRNMARKRKAEPVLIWLQTDLESAYARLQQRDRRKTDDRYAQVFDKDGFEQGSARMQNPKNEDFIVISGKHTFTTQKNAVVRRLYETGLISTGNAQAGLAKPGMVNLVPHQAPGRVDLSRRNIRIH